MDISYNKAETVLNAAIKKANDIDIPVSLAVVDTGGHLVSFARLDSVYGVIDFAIKKARTAAMFRIDNDEMGKMVADADIHGYGMLNSNEGLLTIPGGVVIKDDNEQVIGAIASSGGTPEQDKKIAGTGAQSIL